MKKHLLVLAMSAFAAAASAQTPRLCLFEEFTGEDCPPCAATNPGLNIILANNYSKVAAIKWQVPIPSAPAASWSLYKTNQAEIDWRYKASPAGYGYPSQWTSSDPVTNGVNSAPQGRIDGQHLWSFGAGNDHAGQVTNNLINVAQANMSAFSITMLREWNATGTAITLTVDITATAPFTAVGNLVFRTVMVERKIVFSTAPGKNGEKDFEDVAVKSFPNIQSGTALPGSWTVNQNHTFTLNCVVPSYVRKKEEIAFVGFIQDEGDKKVAQAVRAEKAPMPTDAMAQSAQVGLICTNTMAPQVSVYNNGSNAITNLTIVPSIDNTQGAPFYWTGNIPYGTNTIITLPAMTTPTSSATHTFEFNLTGMNGTDFNMTNNIGRTFYTVASGNGVPNVKEGFLFPTFPPQGFTIANPDAGPGWSRNGQHGAYNLTQNSAQYDFLNNTAIGDMDEMILPATNLIGGSDPILTFDLSYAQKFGSENDKLTVYASSDCGQHWEAMWEQAGTGMATASPAGSGTFAPNPNDMSQWKTEVVPLPGYNKGKVFIKFVTTNDNGNMLYLDNINLVQKNLVGVYDLSNQLVGLSLMPNPAGRNTVVRVSSLTEGTAVVKVFNALGQQVIAKETALKTGSTDVELDLSGLATGMYQVSVTTANGNIVKKLTVSK